MQSSSKHEETAFPPEFIFVLIPYLIEAILSKNCCQKWGLGKIHIEEMVKQGGCLQKGGFKTYALYIPIIWLRLALQPYRKTGIRQLNPIPHPWLNKQSNFARNVIPITRFHYSLVLQEYSKILILDIKHVFLKDYNIYFTSFNFLSYKVICS